MGHQLMAGKFVECYEPRVEITYNKAVVVGKDELQLQVVDTARQDEYTILPYSIIIVIHSYILVYSVTSLLSFQVVKTLHNKLYKRGIFMKLIEEINQVNNSCGRSTSCCLM